MDKKHKSYLLTCSIIGVTAALLSLALLNTPAHPLQNTFLGIIAFIMSLGLFVAKDKSFGILFYSKFTQIQQRTRFFKIKLAAVYAAVLIGAIFHIPLCFPLLVNMLAAYSLVWMAQMNYSGEVNRLQENKTDA